MLNKYITMKRINKTKMMALLCASLIAVMSACKSKTDTAALKKEVLTLHDQVMNEDGKAMNDKIALDTVEKKMPVPRDSAKILSSQLSKLSDSMMDWMHQFDPDQKGKSDDQVTSYLNSQKAQLLKLNSTYKSLLKVSDNYLKKCNVKPGNSMQGMKM